MKPWTHFSRRYSDAGTAGLIERRVELLAVVLAVVLLLQWLLGGISLAMLAEPDAIRPGVGGDSQLVGLERVGTAQREAISARPLFWVSRRPQPVAGSVGGRGAGTTGGQLGNVKLRGVFGSGRTAGVIALVGERETRTLLGESLEGWELEAVHPDRVEFSRSGRRETLFLTPAQDKAARPGAPARQPRRAAAGTRVEPAASAAPVDKQENKQQKRGDPPAGQLGWGGG